MGLWRWLQGLVVPPAVDAPAASPPPPLEKPQPAVPATPLPRKSPRAARVWPAALGSVQTMPDGTLFSAVPAVDLWIHGVPCRAGQSVTFHPNGQLSSATLARAHAHGGETLRAGAAVSMRDDGGLRGWGGVLEDARAFEVPGAGKGVTCTLTLPKGAAVFIEWGKLRTSTSPASVFLDGFEFPPGTELIFGDSGALSHAHLSEPCTLQGVRWSPNDPVIFEFGFLREGYPDTDGELDGVPYLAGEIVRFDDARRMVRCYLREDHTLSGVPCRGGARVYLGGEGELLEGTVAQGVTLDGIPVAEGSVVVLRGGVVVTLTPREEVTVEGVPCAIGRPILRDPAGRLRRATLARELDVRGFTAPAGSELERDASGADILLEMTDGIDAQRQPMPGTWAVLWDAQGVLRMTLPVTRGATPERLHLRVEVTLDGVPVAAKTTALLSPDGALREAVLARDQHLREIPCAGQTRVRFDAQGRLRALTLSHDGTIGGVPCARGRSRSMVMNDVEIVYSELVRLHPDGSVEFATLSCDAEVDGVPLASGRTVARHANGALSVGTLARAYALSDGRVAAAGALFGRFDDGAPSILTLASAHGEYAVGTELRYASPGVLREAVRKEVPLGELNPVDAPTGDDSGTLSPDAS